ncbi:MAG: glycoside hydrolase family 127 protein [Candidatus Brocadiia bacterium]
MADKELGKTIVVDTTESDHAKLRPVPVSSVQLNDEFWAPRLRTNREVTIPDQFRSIEESGRLDNLRRAGGLADGKFEGIYFNDSDIYKWLEAACWEFAREPDDELKQKIEQTVSIIEQAQEDDGYLNSYFTLMSPDKRWENLRDRHELYCAGHMIQAAVAHHRATSSDRMLNVACRFADLICDVFGPGEDQRKGAAGHPEIEMALVELYRTTGNERYLEQARFQVSCRGKGVAGGDVYHQDHIPIAEMTRMVGHAVRAVYLNAGVTDIYTETGAESFITALNKMWKNMVTRQMYVTGSLGSRYKGEAFGRDYELPNERAYAESCAAIASIMWNWRMLMLEGDAKYAEVLERILYNGFLSSISLDGTRYFYQNPLADDGTHRRQEWFSCACCPPNIARMLSSLPGYFYSTSQDGVWVHLFAGNSANLELPDGTDVSLTQRTRYPWEGLIEIGVCGEGVFSVYVRIPEWAGNEAELTVGEDPNPRYVEGGEYTEVRRDWSDGAVIAVNLPMKVFRVVSHPYVTQNVCRVALMRGPFVYCFEQVDNPNIDPREIVLPGPGGVVETSYEDKTLDGIVILRTEIGLVPAGELWENRLYRRRNISDGEATTIGQDMRGGIEMTAVPYFAWGNREPGRMQVWLRSR